jgi:hypothetical protein
MGILTDILYGASEGIKSGVAAGVSTYGDLSKIEQNQQQIDLQKKQLEEEQKTRDLTNTKTQQDIDSELKRIEQEKQYNATMGLAEKQAPEAVLHPQGTTEVDQTVWDATNKREQDNYPNASREKYRQFQRNQNTGGVNAAAYELKKMETAVKQLPEGSSINTLMNAKLEDLRTKAAAQEEADRKALQDAMALDNQLRKTSLRAEFGFGSDDYNKLSDNIRAWRDQYRKEVSDKTPHQIISLMKSDVWGKTTQEKMANVEGFKSQMLNNDAMWRDYLANKDPETFKLSKYAKPTKEELSSVNAEAVSGDITSDPIRNAIKDFVKQGISIDQIKSDLEAKGINANDYSDVLIAPVSNPAKSASASVLKAGESTSQAAERMAKEDAQKKNNEKKKKKEDLDTLRQQMLNNTAKSIPIQGL